MATMQDIQVFVTEVEVGDRVWWYGRYRTIVASQVLGPDSGDDIYSVELYLSDPDEFIRFQPTDLLYIPQNIAP